MPTEEPSLASHANAIIWEQRYIAKQAAFMEAQRKRRAKGQQVTSTEEQRARGRERGRAQRYAKAPPWTRERVTAALRAWHEQHGKWPCSQDWQLSGEGRPSSSRVRDLFGGWKQALEEAQR